MNAFGFHGIAMCGRRLVQVLPMLCLILFPSLLPAQDAGSSPDVAPQKNISERYPPGSFASEKMADTALEEVLKERAMVEARFRNQEQACQTRFFVTSCVDSAGEGRREALIPLRKVEVEANLYKRQQRAQQHDEAHKRRLAEAEIRKKSAVFIDRQSQHEARLEELRQRNVGEEKKRTENLAAYEEKLRAFQARQAEHEREKAERALQVPEEKSR
jgi:hypothetical protein